MPEGAEETDKAGAVERVFGAWRARQANPDVCRLTEARRVLVRRCLRSRSEDELVALITYAHEADVAEARFWRGANAERRQYLGLDNLLRVTKLDDRVERALAWRASVRRRPAIGGPGDAEPTVDLGDHADLRRALAGRREARSEARPEARTRHTFASKLELDEG